MSEKDQHAGNILLTYKSSPRRFVEPKEFKVTVHLNQSPQDLSCIECHAPIEEGMPVVEEEAKETSSQMYTFTWHLSCFSTKVEWLSDLYQVDLIKIQDFISKNPDLLVLERLKGVAS